MNDRTNAPGDAARVIDKIRLLDPGLQALVIDLLDQFLGLDQPSLDDFIETFPGWLLATDDAARSAAAEWIEGRRGRDPL